MATTGATTGYPQPKVVVPSTVSAPFEQRYVLTAVGSGAGIRSGEMKFEFEEGSSPEFLVGISEFYVYSPTGEIETGALHLLSVHRAPRPQGLQSAGAESRRLGHLRPGDPGRRTAAVQRRRRQGQRRNPPPRRRSLAGRIQASSAKTKRPAAIRRRPNSCRKRNRPTRAGAPKPPNTKANTNSPTAPKTRPRKRARSAR